MKEEITNKDGVDISTLSVHQRRELILAEFKRKSRVRTIFRDVPIHEFRDIVSRLTDLLDERVREEEERAVADEARRAIAMTALKDLQEQGIDFNMLKEVQEQSSPGAQARYVKDGVPWTGQGRRPAPFKGLSALQLERFRKVNVSAEE